MSATAKIGAKLAMRTFGRWLIGLLCSCKAKEHEEQGAVDARIEELEKERKKLVTELKHRKAYNDAVAKNEEHAEQTKIWAERFK